MAAVANGKALDVELVVEQFIQFGLKPDKELKDAGIAIAQKIFERIKQHDKYKAARTIIGGSVGKNTDISTKFDFDLVVLVNEGRPLFEKVLDEFEKILKDVPKPALNVQSIKQTSHHSLQLAVNGLKFDLVPGTNFVTQVQASSSEIIELQQQGTMDQILKKNISCYFGEEQAKLNEGEYSKEMTYSSSLVEAQVAFMKRQRPYVHELTRLCKFWNATLYIDEYISGRSTIIELIATHVGIAESKNQKPSLVNGFTEFLTAVKNFNKLNITFDGQKHYGPNCAPIILDPTNPYNNFADSFKPETRIRLMKYAEESLTRWMNWVNKSTQLTYFPLELIFATQSLAIKPGWSVKSYTAYLMKGRKEKQQIMTVKKDSIEKQVQVNAIKAMVDTFVVTAVLAFVNSDIPNMKVDHLSKLAMDNLKRSVCAGGVSAYLEPSTAAKSSAKWDLEFVLPFKVKTPAAEQHCLVLGFEFN